MKKQIKFVLILLLLLALIFSCVFPTPNNTSNLTGTGSTVTTDLGQISPKTIPLSKTGSIEGYIYQSNGKIIISPNRQVSLTPLSGAEVKVENLGSITANTEGYFKLGNIKIGSHELLIRENKFKVTVINQAAVTPYEAEINRNEAIELLKKQLASEKININTLGIMGPQNPLPSETIVASALGDGKGSPAPDSIFKLDGNYWFFFVDLAFNTRFSHPVKYYFINAETGKIVERTADSWPLINAASFYKDTEENMHSPDLVLKPTEKPGGSVSVKRLPDNRLLNNPGYSWNFKTKNHVPGSDCQNPVTYAVIIQGDRREDFDEDAITIRQHFIRQGVNNSNISTIKTFEHENPEAAIENVLNNYYSIMRACDSFFLYITSHGSKYGAFIFEKKLPGGSSGSTEVSSEIEYTFASQFNIRNCPACHITVIADTCYSGNFITMDGVNSFRTDMENKKGLQGLILTASDSTSLSTGYTLSFDGFLWIDAHKKGGLFTQTFIDSFNDPSADINKDGMVSTGEAFFNSDDLEQKPQLWSTEWAGETCGPLPSPTPQTFVQPTVQPSESTGVADDWAKIGEILLEPTPSPIPTSVSITFNFKEHEKLYLDPLSPYYYGDSNYDLSTPQPAVPTPTPSPSPTPGTALRSVILDITLTGTCIGYTAGLEINMSRIEGGHIGSHSEPNCDSDHLHGTVFIDGNGPCADPNPTGCGFGKLTP